ncbi:MAG: porin family protein [Acidobacteria bacterium]|nr:porin family protein [Acidobacteriota bacterium]MCG3193993.1 hypothetical protein [Thermoanaerobaculia bacterium]
MTRRILTLALLLATALALPAAAQNRAGSVEITPFGGAYFGGTLYAGSNALFNRDVEVDTAPVWGIRIAGNFNRNFGLEGSFSMATADITTPNSELFSPDRKLGEMDVRNYELAAMFNFGSGRVVPYITLGAGATYLKASVPGIPSTSDTRFSGVLGAGLKAFFTPQFGFRFDARGRSTLVDNSCGSYYDDCHGDYWDDNDDNHWYWSGEVTGGLTFAF